MVDIAAGGAHSACVTSAGDLYTWGKGRYGRLGHSDSEDQLKPKLVRGPPGGWATLRGSGVTAQCGQVGFIFGGNESCFGVCAVGHLREQPWTQVLGSW